MELFRGYKKNSTFASEIIHGIYAYEVYSANIQKTIRTFVPAIQMYKELSHTVLCFFDCCRLSNM